MDKGGRGYGGDAETEPVQTQRKRERGIHEQHNKIKTTITSKNKTYIPGCIIQIKQLDLVTILLEISFHVGGGGRGGLINRAPKGWKEEKEQEWKRGREILIPNKRETNQHETLTPGIRTACHKLRPVHYHYYYYYYNYEYTNSSVQSNQTKWKRENKNGSIVEGPTWRVR